MLNVSYLLSCICTIILPSSAVLSQLSTDESVWNPPEDVEQSARRQASENRSPKPQDLHGKENDNLSFCIVLYIWQRAGCMLFMSSGQYIEHWGEQRATRSRLCPVWNSFVALFQARNKKKSHTSTVWAEHLDFPIWNLQVWKLQQTIYQTAALCPTKRALSPDTTKPRSGSFIV